MCPKRLRHALPGLEVSTVADEGWLGRRNGDLLRSMAEVGFTHLVTVDRNLMFQQNVTAAGVAVIVVRARTNRITELRPLMAAVAEMLPTVARGQVVHVGVYQAGAAANPAAEGSSQGRAAEEAARLRLNRDPFSGQGGRMPSLNRKKILVATVIPAIGAAVVLFFLLVNRNPAYDRGFESQVGDPAHRTDGPIVLFDEGHLNTHTTTAGYKPLADLLRNDGYRLRVLQQPVSSPELEGVSILVLALARGANDANDHPAYSEAEEVVIERWVRSGGSLLLITDHWPYGSAASSLARRFGVEMGAGMSEDATHHDPDRGASHLIFSEDNGLLRDHPIVRGRSQAERVRRVLTFTGQSLQGPAAAVPFLALSDVATERPPGPPRVERAGGDVRVHMEYGDPLAAAGRAQGLALDVDAGRVVVLGEAGMLRAQRPRDGVPVGMNVPGYDNRQLALNIMHWLSRLL